MHAILRICKLSSIFQMRRASLLRDPHHVKRHLLRRREPRRTLRRSASYEIATPMRSVRHRQLADLVPGAAASPPAASTPNGSRQCGARVAIQPALSSESEVTSPKLTAYF